MLTPEVSLWISAANKLSKMAEYQCQRGQMRQYGCPCTLSAAEEKQFTVNWMFPLDGTACALNILQFTSERPYNLIIIKSKNLNSDQMIVASWVGGGQACNSSYLSEAEPAWVKYIWGHPEQLNKTVSQTKKGKWGCVDQCFSSVHKTKSISSTTKRINRQIQCPKSDLPNKFKTQGLLRLSTCWMSVVFHTCSVWLQKHNR